MLQYNSHNAVSMLHVRGTGMALVRNWDAQFLVAVYPIPAVRVWEVIGPCLSLISLFLLFAVYTLKFA